MKDVVILLVVLSCSMNIYAQVPSIHWQKSYGGTAYEEGTGINPTSDGGYIIVSASMSNDIDVTGNHGSYDYWVIKTNSLGVVQWQKCLGGTGPDWGTSIQETSDGGYVVLGYAQSINDGDVTGYHYSGLAHGDYWVVKLNSTGGIQWQKCLGGFNVELGWDIKQTPDGGFILIGESSSDDGDVTLEHGLKDFWVVKVDNTGTIVWQKCLGGTGNEMGFEIMQTADGGYITVGRSNSNDGDVTGNHGGYDYWIVKLNSLGVIQWQKSYGGTGDDWGSSIKQTSDGGYIINGRSNSINGDVTGNHGSYDYWIVKTDSLGALQWQKSFGGTGLDAGYDVLVTSSGSYYCSGYSESNDGDVTGNHGNKDAWILHFDSVGSILWEKSLGGSDVEYGSIIKETSDLGIICAGYSRSNDGDVTTNYGSADVWVVKLVGTTTGFNNTEEKENLVVSPNPSSGQFLFTCNETNYQIRIFDIAGRLINKNISVTNSYLIDLSLLESGIYFYEVIGSQKTSGRIIKQ